jgi:DNA-binding NarL/FixJ family response regulator
MVVVGEGCHTPVIMQLVESLKPDVILLDIRLGPQNGLDLARQLGRKHPASRIIILTSYDDEAFLLQAAQAGVHGYLLKSASAEVLVEAIRAVHSGQHRLSASLADKAFEQLEVTHRVAVQSRFGLSDEEIQVLEKIAQGMTVQEVAKALFMSERSVKRRIQEILEKMGVSNRTQAVAEAFKHGLL